MIRLFVALELPPQIKMALGALSGGLDGAKWQSDEQLHLTLRFIGEAEPRMAEEIRDMLATIDFNPFEVRLKGVGMFGTQRKPRSVWAGVEDTKPLKHLHEKIDNALNRIGLEPETRKFKPHVTLARFKHRSDRLERFLMAHAGFAAPPFIAEHFALFSSQLSHTGARYIVEERYFALGAQPSEDPFELGDVGSAEQAYMNE